MARKLFPKILVPVDFSPCSEEAFRLACTLAREFLMHLGAMPIAARPDVFRRFFIACEASEPSSAEIEALGVALAWLP